MEPTTELSRRGGIWRLWLATGKEAEVQVALRRQARSRHETEVWLEITNLLIPGLNTSDQELDAITR